MPVSTYEETEGHRMLRRWIRKAPAERTNAAIARSCGCDRVAVYNWLTRLSRPRAEYRQILFVLAGIPQDAWLSGKEHEALKAARKKSRSSGTRAA